MKMYVHIGNGKMIKEKDIIGIFDEKTIEASRENKRIQFYLAQNHLKGKSIILREQTKGEYKEEVSDISVVTLKKRLENEREDKK